MAKTAQLGEAVIDSPHPGEVLQGVVRVNGSSDINGFISSEISFTYMDDPTGTWFLVATSTLPVSSNRLVTWDTTVITDGNYVLRLRVSLSNETVKDVLVSDLRVRNYTPVETPTPHPVTPEATTTPSEIATSTPFPTPTALAQNPAILGPLNVSASMVYGGLAAILIFVIIGIYLWLRRK